MPHYIVNTNTQPSGDHELHRTDTCTRLPLLRHEEALGWHHGCASAVAAAKVKVIELPTATTTARANATPPDRRLGPTMLAWLEEFLIVTDASRRLQIALFAIPVVPSIIVLFGAFQVGGAVPAGQYSALVAAAREAAFYLYVAAAAIACIACIKFVAKEYRGVRKRLFDY